MLESFVSALKDPYWVAKVQGFLGVSYAQSETETNSDKVLSDQIAEFIEDTNDCEVPPSPRPYHRSPSAERLHELADNDISQRREQLTQSRRAVRTNPFLHVYFSLATELGYEPFYITFIPFVFWSYDPYIGMCYSFKFLTLTFVVRLQNHCQLDHFHVRRTGAQELLAHP